MVDAPDAPEPVALREELVNIVLAHSTVKSRIKAEATADAMLEKLMQYYAAAESGDEVTVAGAASDTADNLLQVLHGGATAADQVVTVGSQFVQFMSEAQQTQWRHYSEQLKQSLRTLLHTLT